MNHNDKELRFSIGEVVFFGLITSALYRHYGQRVFRATIGVNVVTREAFEDEESELVVPSHGSAGIVIGSCFMPKHGTGTIYYKVLFGDRLLWVADVHLSK